MEFPKATLSEESIREIVRVVYQEIEKHRIFSEQIREVIKNVNYRPNSICFRMNGTGSDVKLYYEDAEDLEKQVIELNKKTDSIRFNIDEIRSKMKNG